MHRALGGAPVSCVHWRSLGRSLRGNARRVRLCLRLCGCRLTTNDNDDLVVGNIKDRTLAEISRGDEAWGIIKGFYEGKRPHTCLECTFYQPINQSWFEERAKNGK